MNCISILHLREVGVFPYERGRVYYDELEFSRRTREESQPYRSVALIESRNQGHFSRKSNNNLPKLCRVVLSSKVRPLELD